jgi:hypothetical protein
MEVSASRNQPPNMMETSTTTMHVESANLNKLEETIDMHQPLGYTEPTNDYLVPTANQRTVQSFYQTLSAINYTTAQFHRFHALKQAGRTGIRPSIPH